MRFLVVDSDPSDLSHMVYILRQLYPLTEVVTAVDYSSAMESGSKLFDVAFLEAELPRESGLNLAEDLQMVQPQLNIIFVTKNPEYAIDAFLIHASGYILKPYRKEHVMEEIRYLRYPITELEVPKVRVQCFGHFEVFVNNEVMRFERGVSKEILAYLIHIRGASATRREICETIWDSPEEIERKKGYFRNLIAALRHSLKAEGVGEMLITHRDSYAVNMQVFDCDYYHYLDGKTGDGILKQGYMTQYPWAKKLNMGSGLKAVSK